MVKFLCVGDLKITDQSHQNAPQTYTRSNNFRPKINFSYLSGSARRLLTSDSLNDMSLFVGRYNTCTSRKENFRGF